MVRNIHQTASILLQWRLTLTNRCRQRTACQAFRKRVAVAQFRGQILGGTQPIQKVPLGSSVINKALNKHLLMFFLYNFFCFSLSFCGICKNVWSLKVAVEDVLELDWRIAKCSLMFAEPQNWNKTGHTNILSDQTAGYTLTLAVLAVRQGIYLLTSLAANSPSHYLNFSHTLHFSYRHTIWHFNIMMVLFIHILVRLKELPRCLLQQTFFTTSHTQTISLYVMFV